MSEPLTVRVRAKGDGRLRAVDADGHTLLARYVGRDANGAPLALGEPVPAMCDGDDLMPANAMLRRAVLDGDLEVVAPAPAPIPEET